MSDYSSGSDQGTGKTGFLERADLLPTGGFKDLGTTKLARQLGLTDEQTNGHWCSRCRGIWFGYTLEAECPICGNRHG